MPKRVNKLSMDDIQEFMEEQYDPRQFVDQERCNFWLIKKCQPGETVHELAARTRQAATICDFASMKDIQEEAMQMLFVCCVSNEAVLKAFFKVDAEQ